MNNSVLIAVGLAVASLPPGAFAQGGGVEAKAQTCAACHGPTGNSTDSQYPKLAGQTARYIYLELKDFKEGRRRHDPQMEPMVKNLSPEDMLGLADYYSKQPSAPTGFKADGVKVTAGAKKADEVLCTMCHSGGFSGQNEIPRVAGQHYAYIKKQLTDFKTRQRTNDAGNMTSVASTLSEADIENLAQYIANL